MPLELIFYVAQVNGAVSYTHLHERGRLRAGAWADLVFLTPTIEVVRTLVAGVTCYQAG